MKDRGFLINMYNATSTDDGTGDIESYEAWLERQLLSRIDKLEQLDLRSVGGACDQLPTETCKENRYTCRMGRVCKHPNCKM